MEMIVPLIESISEHRIATGDPTRLGA